MLTGLRPTVSGELALKALEAVQVSPHAAESLTKQSRAILTPRPRLPPFPPPPSLTVPACVPAVAGRAAQTGLPMASLSVLAGPISMHEPRALVAWWTQAAPSVILWAGTAGTR